MVFANHNPQTWLATHTTCQVTMALFTLQKEGLPSAVYQKCSKQMENMLIGLKEGVQAECTPAWPRLKAAVAASMGSLSEMHSAAAA